MKDVQVIVHDWKETDNLITSLIETMRYFGLYVYDDPKLVGTDSFGYIISNIELTEDEILEESEKYHWE